MQLICGQNKLLVGMKRGAVDSISCLVFKLTYFI